jgi:hypothetical protein
MKRETRTKLIRIINSKEQLIFLISKSLNKMISPDEYKRIEGKFNCIDDDLYLELKTIAMKNLDKFDPVGRAAKASAIRHTRGGRKKKGKKTKKHQKGGDGDNIQYLFGCVVAAGALAWLLSWEICANTRDRLRNTGIPNRIFSSCTDRCRTDPQIKEDREVTRLKWIEKERKTKWKILVDKQVRAQRGARLLANKQLDKINNILRIDGTDEYLADVSYEFDIDTESPFREDERELPRKYIQPAMFAFQSVDDPTRYFYSDEDLRF